MNVKLTMSTPQIEISNNAKICYATTTAKDITSSLVHNNGHLAALRFAYATVAVEGISVACQNQIVRSPHLSYMVQSKRYVNADKGEFEFIMPEGLDERQQSVMDKCWYDSKHSYETLLNLGVKKEDARAILPANTSTKMNVTGNLQAWWDFFKLRLNSHAQREVRMVAEGIYVLLQREYPLVFTDDIRTRLRNQA